ncbi:MAG: CoA-binding protein, partial [Dehalococcoidia bacterium]|nr:CoA-binding protein [Dehalococcoidia bacterium]
MSAQNINQDSRSGKDLDWLFHPRSIAVIGVSDNIDNWGYTWLKNQREAGFKGKLYPVHPRGGEVLGLKVYPKVTDIPDPVDYAISSIPASAILQLVEDCIQKGVRALHLFTAGFSETGEAVNAELEQRVIAKARQGGLRIVGPNCMGIYCPESGLTFDPTLSKESGGVAFISQSGGNAREIGWAGTNRRVRFSKIISYGNASDLNESDYLEYCTFDPKTTVIGAYIEGVRDGRRFFRALKEAARRKPVIILKAGRSEAGSRAAASHTASLAGSGAPWSALFPQCGAIPVYSLPDMLDLMQTFLYLKAPAGRRTAVIGGGGGASVIAADDCFAAGLQLPPLDTKVREDLARFTPSAGTSVRNPVDGNYPRRPHDLYTTIKIVAASPQIDMIISHVGLEFTL